MYKNKRQLLLAAGALSAGALLPVRLSNAAGKSAVIAATLEISHATSLSDDAIIAGLTLALQDLQATAGAHTWSWEFLKYDNAAIPSRGIDALHKLAQHENVVGIFTGKFSPVVLAMRPVAQELGIPLFTPWSAVDEITADPKTSQFVFRLSMRDSWAMSKIAERAAKRDYRKLGLLAPNSSWGRSCVHALEKKLATLPRKITLDKQHYNWGGENTLLPQYLALKNTGAQALVMIANEPEAALLAKEIVQHLSATQRLPILSHWGLVGGDTIGLSNQAILQLDIAFVQTFNFRSAKSTAAAALATRAATLLGVDNIHRFPAQVGIAHAYDLMMMVGTAIRPLPAINGPAVVKAMTNIQSHQGIVKRYTAPYARGHRDALSENDVFFCRYAANGEIRPEPF